jgi:indolepyruvate ferredoxin oxidoreductase
VRRVQQAELACVGRDPTLPLTKAVARSLMKLMSYKDEYEVARLFTDGGFQRQLTEQFEGDLTLEFLMAPPWLARPRNGQAPKKVRLGEWMLPAMRLLARGKVLRGRWIDPFGNSAERRMERDLVTQFERRVDELVVNLIEDLLPIAIQIAALPLSMRGYGHVKVANVALARAREAELLSRWLPDRYPRPTGTPTAGQFRGIAVVSR